MIKNWKQFNESNSEPPHDMIVNMVQQAPLEKIGDEDFYTFVSYLEEMWEKYPPEELLQNHLDEILSDEQRLN